MTSPKRLSPFPVSPSAADSGASGPARPPNPVLIIRGDPTPDEIAAVTAVILAVLPRRGPGPARSVGERADRPSRARWSRSDGAADAGSWRSAG
ncbi:acyl-CoA carboxylase epsilon subunit [Streptomyces sp. NPDC048415]|jgi:hypothetical protein|uniref:acyl-CoA carboxylase epsilon subunit n=1 Tax=Streptomyces sp. NPDC048415 TaxID=3154822 RepID=UPI003445E2E8